MFSLRFERIALLLLLLQLATPLSCLFTGSVLVAAVSDSGHASRVAFFENRVRPVLAEHCYPCHSGSASPLKAGLRLDSRESILRGGESGPALVPGEPGKSLLLRAIRHENGELKMPLKKPRLSAEILAGIETWIAGGAVFPEGTLEKPTDGHWAFQPVKNPLPPPTVSTWPQTSIDRFILTALESRGLQPAEKADKRTLLRRATYDLTGLPPTPEEFQAFEQDSAADAFERVVDRLLASPAYGERWGRHWLDLVRYADTAGETADYPVPVAWRYRNYVIRAFNADKPYDQFLKEQIAGDILARRGPRELYSERVVATGYLGISRRFGFDSENYHHLTIQDTIDTLGQTVLGLTLGCARCHAHKYDPVSLQDYYALYGIFESTRYAFPGSEQKQKHRAMVPLLPEAESKEKWRTFDEQVARLSSRLESLKKPVPAAVLRSLDDLDGDFEMQAPAAGGSKGVLVAPWVYEGPIAVTKEAQSPFKNLHALGKVGASVQSGTNGYSIAQALHPRRMRGDSRKFWVNLDFRIATNSPSAAGWHRFWLGSSSSSPAIELLISPNEIRLAGAGNGETLAGIQPGGWNNLQIVIDLKTARFSGRAGKPGSIVAFGSRPLRSDWNGVLDHVALDSRAASGRMLPGIEIDNLGIQETEMLPVSTDIPPLPPADGQTNFVEISARLNELLAEGPFELAYAVSEGTPRNARIQIRGEPDRPGEEVPRGFLQVLGGGKLGATVDGSGRLELAEFLVEPRNPLTARVMVNRIWQQHFGQGLVRTPNDFGRRGQPPTHPELLDHLATRFVQSGWSIKAMHRLILSSAVYQQASLGNNSTSMGHDRAKLDPDQYASFPRRRLGAEEIRDSILFASGDLDSAPGAGHPFPKPTGWGYTQHGPFSAVYDHNKRSIYLMTQRIKRHPFLALFDGADPNSSTAERRVTTVPTQALFFLNDPFVHARAEHLAERIHGNAGSPEQQVVSLYQRVLGRLPKPDELAESSDFLADYRKEPRVNGGSKAEWMPLAALARVLFGSNEFISLD